MRVIELARNKVNTKSKSEVADMIKTMRKEDEKMVKGMFEFVDAEGGYFEFTWRKFPGDPIQTIQLVHGETCEMPMGIVKHLNGTKKKIRRYKDVEQTAKGSLKLPRTYDSTSRVRFTPLDYL